MPAVYVMNYGCCCPLFEMLQLSAVVRVIAETTQLTSTSITETLKPSSLRRLSDRSLPLFANVNINFADFVRFRCVIDRQRALCILNKVPVTHKCNNTGDVCKFLSTIPVDSTSFHMLN